MKIPVDNPGGGGYIEVMPVMEKARSLRRNRKK